MSEQQAKQKNWFARHKVLTVIGALIVLSIIGSTGGSQKSSNNNDVHKVATTPSTQTNASSPTPEVKSEYAVGEMVAIGDQTLLVTKITRNFNTNNPYSKPENGKEYVVVAVQIENKGSDQIDFNTYDFQIQDSNGVLKSEGFIVGVENKLSSGNLAAGGKVAGNLAFEVPKGDAGLKLIFKPSFWSSKTITVKL